MLQWMMYGRALSPVSESPWIHLLAFTQQLWIA